MRVRMLDNAPFHKSAACSHSSAGPTPPKMWAVTVRQLEKHAAVLCCRHFLVFA